MMNLDEIEEIFENILIKDECINEDCLIRNDKNIKETRKLFNGKPFSLSMDLSDSQPNFKLDPYIKFYNDASYSRATLCGRIYINPNRVVRITEHNNLNGKLPYKFSISDLQDITTLMDCKSTNKQYGTIGTTTVWESIVNFCRLNNIQIKLDYNIKPDFLNAVQKINNKWYRISDNEEYKNV